MAVWTGALGILGGEKNRDGVGCLFCCKVSFVWRYVV